VTVPAVSTEIAVVGAGVMGAATAYELARAGRRVMLVERHAVGHAHGSSHGTSRVFRLAYPDASLVRLAQESHAGWDRLEEAAGEPLLLRTGSLVLGDIVPADASALDRAEVSFERLTGAEAGWRWPIAIDDDEDVLYQPNGAVILADRAHAAFVQGAIGAGGDLLEQTRVREISPHAQGIRLSTETGEIEAKAVVVTAGAWAADLLRPLSIGLEVTVTRETVAHYALEGAAELPAMIDATVPPPRAGEQRPEQITYALASPGIGVKVGLHDSGPTTDPDEPGTAAEHVVRWASAWALHRFPQIDPSPVAAETCLYTSTPDAGFLIQRHGRLVVGSACSGHGFKFAPAVGRRLADLAVEATEA
jgi:sarcosine oxidase